MYYSSAIENILAKARCLEDHTVGQFNSTVLSEGSGNKGSFGQYLEECYFGIANNSRPEPDFWPIPVELKATPLKYSETKKCLVPKERIVLGIINYNQVVNETFESSHFKFKNQIILIVWYIHDKLASNENIKVNLTDIWECIKEDGAQIEHDWNTIVAKVRSGHAEDISEGDTLYIGACTKGSTAATSFRQQPYSPIPAKQRAFCFKISYVNHIYEVMKGRKSNRPISQIRLLQQGESQTLEEKVTSLFQPFMGLSVREIEEKLNYTTAAKSKLAVYARRILGFSEKTNSIYEIDASNIQIKTIRVEENGKIKEDMSFKNIDFKELPFQDWEDSDLYQELVSKFIFVIFQKSKDKNDYIMKQIKFWNMPERDIDEAKLVWEKTKSQVLEKQFDALPKKSENPVIHVRTKGKDSSDLTETHCGVFISKRCFFLNNSYIRQAVLY